jgi:CheY-like chemotaxis protein
MLKILLADDSVTNRKLFSRIIHSLGYVPMLASDGARALQMLEDNPDIACVITDCQMPVLDGPGLIRAIRSGATPEVPVMIYSAFMGLKDVSGLLELGASRFLNYPLKREDVKECLESHLQHG